MITNTFDPHSEEIIKIWRNEDAPRVTACIPTFSHRIFAYILEHYDCEHVGDLQSSNGAKPVYIFPYRGKKFATYMSFTGAPGCVADMEDVLSIVNTDKFVVFGGSGCLNREIARGKVMVPTEAYRDEGASYHYAPASDYIAVKNSDIVAKFMQEAGLPFVQGKTWTTDAMHRETRANFEKRKADGCISVEMECAAVQAMCDFRALEVYYFLTSGDLLDAPKWDMRMEQGQIQHTQHDGAHFAIALELACFISA